MLNTNHHNFNQTIGQALQSLKNARADRSLNTSIYNATIETIANSNRPNASLAIQLLEESEAAGLADAMTYSFTADAIARSNEPDHESEALTCLSRAHELGLSNYPIMRENHTIDLHGLTFGSIYFGLKIIIQELAINSSEEFHLTLICGESSPREEYQFHRRYPAKQAALKVTREIGFMIHTRAHEDKENPGVFHMYLSREPAIKKTLNPTAKPFFPSSPIDTSNLPSTGGELNPTAAPFDTPSLRGIKN